MSGDTVYVTGAKELATAQGGRNGVIIALNRLDGSVLWRWETPRQARATDLSWAPTVVGRMLLASSVLGNEILALDRFSGATLWRVAGDPSGGSSEGIVVVGDTVYSGSIDDTAAAHELQTGHLLWRSAKTAASITGVAVCDDRLVVVNLGFETLDRHTGQRLLSGLHGGGDFILSGPTAANHVVYMTGLVAAYAFRCD